MTTSQPAQVTAKQAAQQQAIALHQQRNRRERWIMIGTVAIVVAAWFYGYFAAGVDASVLVDKVLPG